MHSHDQNPLCSRSSKSRNGTKKLDAISTNVEFFGFLLSNVLGLLADTIRKIIPHWITRWFKWCPTSSQTLEVAEKEILSNLKNPYSVMYINIGPCWGSEDNFVWTLKMNSNDNSLSEKIPLVLVHGFASALGLWIANLDSLSTSNPLYAFDMLGFGRSSRPSFSSHPAEAEQQFVTSIELWREAIGLDQMILLGHSMGGFLATSYAIHFPERVALLILVDPWGFPERPISIPHKYALPSWVKFVHSFLRGFNFLAILRAAGPLGPYLVDKFRRDMQHKYSNYLKNKKSITQYIYHCNAQLPSGEVGFKALADDVGWSKYPMISRIGGLDENVPIMFIYGSRSWANRQPALQIKYTRLNSFVEIQVIDSAGHHVYADRPDEFNCLLQTICERQSR